MPLVLPEYHYDYLWISELVDTISVVLQLLFALSLAVAAFSIVALAVMAWRFVFFSGHPGPELSLDWVYSLSVERYLPMLRLLDESDLRFLEVQPRFTDSLVRRVREHRYRMFMAYLNSLRRDFNSLAAAVKQILTASDRDRSSLAFALLRTQIAFGLAFVTVYGRAYAWRLGLGAVDAHQLLQAFQGIHVELRSAAPRLGAA